MIYAEIITGRLFLNQTGTDREIRQLRYVLRRNLNKLRILRTVGDFNEWKSYLNLIKMCSKNKI